MTLAPIALFAYNRPEHLRRTMESLLQNPLARKTDIYVFSDGAKTAADRPRVERVRAYLHTLKQSHAIQLAEADVNKGLARSIIEGVTKLCNSHGRAVVLEDDLLLAPGCLEFMNRALDRYAQEPRVMQVSGYMFPVDRPEELPEAFFCKLSPSWGWATWKRAWDHFEPDSGKLLSSIERNARQRDFDMNDTYPYTEMLAAQANGRMDVWGVRWYASMFLRDGLCLYPSQSLIVNHGMDGSGVHCGVSNAFDVRLSQRMDWNFPDKLEESKLGLQKIENLFRGLQDRAHPGILKRIARRAQSVARGLRNSVR
jgi:hypothetical protein